MDRNTGVLRKMLEEIDFLQTFTKVFGFEEYMQDEIKKQTVAMTFINLGELVRHLTKDFRKENSDMPFDEIIGLRDVAAHGYKVLKFERIWNTVKINIPELKIKLNKLIN